MAKKLFQLALESSDLEGAVAPESTGPALDESQLEENVEETTQAQAEVESGSDEIDEAIEEVDQLQEQIEANDKKLENPDEVVTTVDVEVSEESLKRACYKLGIPMKAKLSFATESVVDGIRSNPRKYLAVSNEGLKDVVKAIIDALKVMIKKLAQLINEVYTKISFKFANYTKQIDAGIKSLSEIKEFDNDKIKEALSTSGSAELQFALINNEVVKSPDFKSYLIKGAKAVDDISAAFKNSESLFKEKMTDMFKDIIGSLAKEEAGIAKVSKNDEIAKSYGMKPFGGSDGHFFILGISGKKALLSDDDDVTKIIKVTLEPDEAALNAANLNATNLANSVIKASGEYKKDVSNFKNNLNEIKKVQKACDKTTYEMTQLIDGKAAKWAYMGIKSVGITTTTFEMDRYIGVIRAYVKLINILAANSKQEAK